MWNRYCAWPAGAVPEQSTGGAFAIGSIGAARVCGRRTPRNHDDLARCEMVSAMRADHIRYGLRAAGAMYQRHRRPRFVAEPGVAPSHHRDEHGIELESLAGQPILDAAAVALAASAIEDSVAHQIAQPLAQDVARDSGSILKLVEAMASEKRLAQYQHRPALADYRQRPRHGAVHILDRIPSHRRLSLSYPKLDFHVLRRSPTPPPERN